MYVYIYTHACFTFITFYSLCHLLPFLEVSCREFTSRHFPFCSGKCCRSFILSSSVCHNHNSWCCQSLHLKGSERCRIRYLFSKIMAEFKCLNTASTDILESPKYLDSRWFTRRMCVLQELYYICQSCIASLNISV